MCFGMFIFYMYFLYGGLEMIYGIFFINGSMLLSGTRTTVFSYIVILTLRCYSFPFPILSELPD